METKANDHASYGWLPGLLVLLAALGLPTLGAAQEEEQANCCSVDSGEFVGMMAPAQCLSKPNRVPDIAAYAEEVKACKTGGGGGGGGEEDDSDIPNGDFEEWDQDQPVGFMNFDSGNLVDNRGNKVSALLAQQGADMRAVFRSSDAHTGSYSLHLKGRRMKLPGGLPIPRSMIPVMAGGITSCGDNCERLASGQLDADVEALSFPIATSSENICGVYKAHFVGGDVLWINVGVHAGGQVIGGTNSGPFAINSLSENAAEWTEFRLPITMLPGHAGQRFDRATVEITLKGPGNMRALSGKNPRRVMGVHEGTEAKVDSVRFCGALDLTIHKPKVINGQEIHDFKEMSVGAQTFVNLDNDDENDKFDFDDEAMSRDDDELVEIVLSLPPKENGFIELRQSAPGGAVKVWEDARKSKAFEQVDEQVEYPGYLEEEDGEFRKHLWVEGLEPSAKQRDVQFVFAYKQQKDQSTEESDEVALTILGIEKIEWQGQGNGLDDGDDLDEEPNWAEIKRSIRGEPGGEVVRVFPGKKVVGGAPGDRAKDRVKLVVTLSVKPVEPVGIFFRAFDVDDPTSDEAPVDDESTDNDNRGASPAPTGIFPISRTSVLKADFDEQEEEFEFQVTLQPGDNFRVAGYGDRDFLMGLENPDQKLSQAEAGDGLRLIDPDVLDGGVPPDNADIQDDDKYYSGVLTVWRYLYTEVDTMGPVKDNFIEGTIISFTAAGTAANGAPQYTVGISQNIYSKRPSKRGTEGLKDSFKNGRMTIGGVEFFVMANTANASGPDEVLLVALSPSGALDASAEGKHFKMIDDDRNHNLVDGAPLPPLPMDRLAPALEPAFVLPREGELTNSRPNVPFLLNYFTDEDPYLKSIYAFDNVAYHRDRECWVVYLLNAFQGIATEDADGAGTGAISGQADGPGDSSMGAAIYQESGQELEDAHKPGQGWRLSDAVPHEIGHLFGGTHSDDGLMDDRDAKKSQDFSPTTLNTIRSAKYP